MFASLKFKCVKLLTIYDFLEMLQIDCSQVKTS
jgi:hypothetical protein